MSYRSRGARCKRLDDFAANVVRPHQSADLSADPIRTVDGLQSSRRVKAMSAVRRNKAATR